MNAFRSRRRGFTLIELVVVLMILAILAGLVVSIVGWVRRSANYASASNNQNTIMANLELFRTTFGNGAYPNRFDSLLTTGGDEVPDYMHPDLVAMITPGNLNPDELQCIDRSFPQLMYHVGSLTGIDNPGNSATQQLQASTGVAILNTSNSNAQQLLTALGYVDSSGAPLLPSTPSAVRLILVGVGPSNTAIGRTMQSPPFDTNVDTSTQYNRFIGVFAVYSPRLGKRTQLKAVLCPRGRLLNRNLSEFYQSTNPD